MLHKHRIMFYTITFALAAFFFAPLTASAAPKCPDTMPNRWCDSFTAKCDSGNRRACSELNRRSSAVDRMQSICKRTRGKHRACWTLKKLFNRKAKMDRNYRPRQVKPPGRVAQVKPPGRVAPGTKMRSPDGTGTEHSGSAMSGLYCTHEEKSQGITQCAKKAIRPGHVKAIRPGHVRCVTPGDGFSGEFIDSPTWCKEPPPPTPNVKTADAIAGNREQCLDQLQTALPPGTPGRAAQEAMLLREAEKPNWRGEERTFTQCNKVVQFTGDVDYGKFYCRIQLTTLEDACASEGVVDQGYGKADLCCGGSLTECSKHPSSKCAGEWNHIAMCHHFGIGCDGTYNDGTPYEIHPSGACNGHGCDWEVRGGQWMPPCSGCIVNGRCEYGSMCESKDTDECTDEKYQNLECAR